MNRQRIYKLLGFAAALVVFFLLRLEHLQAVLASPVGQIPIIDSLYYLEVAKRVAAGLGLGPHPFFMSPLYSLFIAFAKMIGNGFIVSALHLQIIISALTLLLIGRYASRRIAHWTGGPVAALLYALYAPSIYYDGVLVSAALILFLTMVALTLLDVRPNNLYLWRVVFAAVAVGLSALARPNALILIPAVIFVFFWWSRNKYKNLGFSRAPAISGELSRERRTSPSSFTIKKALGYSLVFAAVVVLVIMPALMRNVRLGGELMLTTSSAGINFFIGNHEYSNGLYTEVPWVASAEPGDEAIGYEQEAARRTGEDMDPASASRYWMGEALDWIVHNPLGWIGLEAKKLAWFFHGVETPNNVSIYGVREYSPIVNSVAFFTFGVLVAFAIPGLIGFKGGWRAHLPRVVIAAYLLANLLFFVAGEYRYPVVGILLVYATVTVYRVIGHFRAADPIPSLKALITVILLILITHIPWPTMRTIASAETDYFNWAGVSYRQGDLMNASLLYSAALAERPGWRDAHLQLAFVFRDLGMREEAIREFEAAGVSQEDLQRLQAEEEMLAARWFTDSPDTMSSNELSALSARFNVLGRHHAAIGAAEQALVKDSTNARAKFEYGFALESTGRYHEAIAIYQRLEIDEKKDPMIPWRIAWSYYALGNGSQAYKALQRAKEKARKLPDGAFRDRWIEKLETETVDLLNY